MYTIYIYIYIYMVQIHLYICIDIYIYINVYIYSEPGCDSGSTVVQTAWALLALMAADCKVPGCPNCRCCFLRKTQQKASGSYG